MKIVKLKIENSGKGGYAAIASTIITLVVSVAIIGSFTSFSLREVGVNRAFVKSIESQYIAEGGIEDVVYRIVTGKQVGASETLAVGSGTTTITVTQGSGEKTIRSEGVRDPFGRVLSLKLNTSTTNVSFMYGVQIGDGGLKMENLSRVEGSVYVNGNITGENIPVITGDAFTASSSSISGVIINGSARAHTISEVIIGKHASSTTLLEEAIVGKDTHAATIQDSIITRDAFYQTIDNDTIVFGVKYPGSKPPQDVPKL